MKLSELIAECRRLTDDYASPPLWADPEWRQHLNEAEREACVRARLLVDDSGRHSELILHPGTRRHRLNDLVIDVLEARTDDDRLFTGWTLDESHFIVDRPVSESTRLTLTVQRYPLREMVEADSSPEIRPQHHIHLVQWALYRAYLKRDADTFDPTRSATHEALFDHYFGPRPTANVLRKQRRKTPRVVRPIPF